MPLVLGWLLNLVYTLLLVAVSPVLMYRRVRHGKYRGGWNEKLTGRLKRKSPDRPCIWFHAVSVGEVLQLQRVLDETAATFPDAELLITTTTGTGYEQACNKYPKHTVAYFPLDFTWAVRKALDAIRPAMVVLVELELWPNLIFECQRRRIPLAVINGRISEKSFRGYSRLKPLIRHVVGALDLIAVQNDTYAHRFLALGAPASRIAVTGNIKFDRIECDRGNLKTLELRRAFGISPHERVFIAGSTQSPEESFALNAWKAVREEFRDVRLIIVPRHKERFDEVADLIERQGIPLRRRSRGIAADEQASTQTVPPVLLLDTLGELASCWGLAEIAFVGGSLTQRGGQNMIEPAGFGAAVMFGPNTWNFKEVTEALLSRDAARVVHSEDELTQALQEFLQTPATAQLMGRKAKEFVVSQQGATRRTIGLMAPLVSICTATVTETRAA